MPNPQQPELARSRKVSHEDQDAVATVVEGQEGFREDGPRGPVPPDNQPGHHPAKEQDKPELDAFAAKLGTAPPEDRPTDNEATPFDSGRNRPAWANPALAAAGAGAGFLAVRYFVRRRRRRAA